MGLVSPVAELLAFEATYRPLSGDVAVLGKQTAYVTEPFLAWLLRKYDLQRPPELPLEFDSVTWGAKGKFGQHYQLITDESFFRVLGARSYSAIDVSSYEGADIIHDMSQPVPQTLHSRFDVIYDGSSLDNIYNPAQALTNMSSMLRPGGRLFISEHGTLYGGAYTAFSPGWFFDFFVANKYRDCKVYVGAFSDDQTLRYGPWSPLRIYNWYREKSGITPRNTPGLDLMIFVIAEKGLDSTDSALPVQFQYRDSEYNKAVFFPNVETISRATRPAFHADLSNPTHETTKTYVACADLCVGAPL